MTVARAAARRRRLAARRGCGRAGQGRAPETAASGSFGDRPCGSFRPGPAGAPRPCTHSRPWRSGATPQPIPSATASEREPEPERNPSWSRSWSRHCGARSGARQPSRVRGSGHGEGLGGGPGGLGTRPGTRWAAGDVVPSGTSARAELSVFPGLLRFLLPHPPRGSQGPAHPLGNARNPRSPACLSIKRVSSAGGNPRQGPQPPRPQLGGSRTSPLSKRYTRMHSFLGGRGDGLRFYGV